MTSSTDSVAPAPFLSDFDVVAVVGSAGAGPASLQLLRDLPPGFDVPLVLAFHLSPESTLPQMYARLPFQADWAAHGESARRGQVLVCPPRHALELLPDGSFVLSPCHQGALDRPLDRFLVSVARSFADRAAAVVLTGMSDDGIAGALELRRVGGHVVVQSEASAEFPSMPAAAIAAGAADIVIPLSDLGHLLGELMQNTPRMRMRSEVSVIERAFGHDGEMAARAREVDWSRTPLGPAIDWPEALRVSMRTIMASPDPQALWWGPELVQVYNDAWRNLLGVAKHPQALGGRARDSWPEVWHEIGVLAERVYAEGTVESGDNFPLLVQREDHVEEVFATFSYSPVRDEATGAVVGVYNNVRETTRNVVSERRLQALRTLAVQLAGAQGVRDACERAARALAGNPQDVPFALLYVFDSRRRQATLVSAAGVTPGAACAPHVIALDGQSVWPLAAVLEERAGTAGTAAIDPPELLLTDLASRCEGLAPVPLEREGALPPQSALLRRIEAAAGEAPIGAMVIGLSPHRHFDEGCRSFVDLIVRQVDAGIGQGRAIERERERLERLAELDRIKTEFFANVSHEFRTPLTLLLAPLEQLLLRKDSFDARLAADLEVATRNARRLMALVTHLLDFSQLESRRQPAQLAPVDLCALTTDIASHFRSAIEAAGLQLQVGCDAHLPQVPVDPEMWTSVISNLLSNALKFTFEGRIALTLRALRLHAELLVADTGIGIPADELPHVFKRFHRVRGARARTAEGAGIGLAMVQDQITRMGGQVQVRSREGSGTSFVIWMPYKSMRMPPGPAAEPPPPPFELAAELAQQARRWGARDEPEGVLHDLIGAPAKRPGEAAGEPGGCIVVVDDNADMRAYLRRLLGEHWRVETAADAPSGLGLVRRLRPQVLVADVMMPGADGFELLREVRADASLVHLPVVLVTARAGEAAAIEALTTGADDYIAKPFSPRELLARVRVVIERARAEAALRRSQAWLAAQKEAFQAAMNGHPLAESLGILARMVIDESYGQSRCAFYIADAHGTGLVHVVGMPEGYAARVNGLRISPESLSCGLAAATGEPVLTRDVHEEPRWRDWLPVAAEFDFRACWSFPVETATGTLVGSLAMYWREPREAAPHDVELAAAVTHTAAIIISRDQETQQRMRMEAALAAPPLAGDADCRCHRDAPPGAAPDPHD